MILVLSACPIFSFIYLCIYQMSKCQVLCWVARYSGGGDLSPPEAYSPIVGDIIHKYTNK